MKKTIIIAVLAFGMNVTAQTTTNGNVVINGSLRAGIGGSALGLKVNGYAEVTQNLYVNGYTFTNEIVATSGAVKFNGARLSGVRAGVDGNDAVNMNQLNQKADKAQVAKDIAKAKEESLAYTDTKVKAVNDKLDLEIEANRLAQKRLDDKINSNDEKINQRVRDLEIKIDNRFNAVMSYVGNEFAAVNNRIEGLGAATVALGAAATSQVYNSSKPTNLNVGTGVYGKATAIAVGMSHYFNQNTKLSVNWASGSNTKNLVGIGCGISF